MKINSYNLSFTLPLSLLIVLFSGQIYAKDKSKLCKIDITALIKSYQKALNGADVSTITKLYSKKGIFMPSGKPTAEGRTQVKKAYENVFGALKFKVNFHISEIEWRGDMAFVRTISDGKIKLLKKQVTISNNSREIFILKRINGTWKISRYMFNEAKS